MSVSVRIPTILRSYTGGAAEVDAEHGTLREVIAGLDTAYPGSLVTTPLADTAPTSYLRKSFNFPGDPSRTTLRLTHTVADGAVFYLNGSEIYRANMPGGAVTHSTPAGSIVTASAQSAAVIG